MSGTVKPPVGGERGSALCRQHGETKRVPPRRGGALGSSHPSLLEPWPKEKETGPPHILSGQRHRHPKCPVSGCRTLAKALAVEEGGALSMRWRSARESEITGQTRIQSLRINLKQTPGPAGRGEGPPATLPEVVGAQESWVTCPVPDPFSGIVNPHNKAVQ